MNALLKPGAGPTVELAMGDPALDDLVGNSNKGRGPIKLNVDKDLFGGEGHFFQAALIHEAAHWASTQSMTLGRWFRGVPVDSNTLATRAFRLDLTRDKNGLTGDFDGTEGHAAEILQFGDILTITMDEE